MSNRRAARGANGPQAITVDGIPVALAQGPCVETWGSGPDDLFGARSAWKAARDGWAIAQGLDPRRDYRLLPSVLRDRAPYYLDPEKDACLRGTSLGVPRDDRG